MGGLSPTKDEQPDSKSRTPRSTSQNSPSADNWKWQIFFAICSLGLALFMALRRRPSVLSHSYALCSQQGDNIYTVDVNNARAECIVVEDSHIVDRGPLSRFSRLRRNIFEMTTFSIETVQAQWLQSRSSNLEIRTIPQGAIVVPGFSGNTLSRFIIPNHFSSRPRFPCSHTRIWCSQTTTSRRRKNG